MFVILHLDSGWNAILLLSLHILHGKSVRVVYIVQADVPCEVLSFAPCLGCQYIFLLYLDVEAVADSDCISVNPFQCFLLALGEKGVVDRRAILNARAKVATV